MDEVFIERSNSLAASTLGKNPQKSHLLRYLYYLLGMSDMFYIEDYSKSIATNEAIYDLIFKVLAS